MILGIFIVIILISKEKVINSTFNKLIILLSSLGYIFRDIIYVKSYIILLLILL